MTKKTPARRADPTGLAHAGTYLQSHALKKLLNDKLSLEAEEALGAGALGFMARAMVMASLPHSNPKTHPGPNPNEFVRRNGDFSLVIMAPSDVGLPYGSIPRLLIAWLTTEALKTEKRELILGDSLSGFMRQLGLAPTGGHWGSIGRLKNQTDRLFSASIKAFYRKERTTIRDHSVATFAELWWHPKDPKQASLWESRVTLGEEFFKEILERPVPVDMRALNALKRSPMALDIYVWLTYRMSYLKKPTDITWEGLQLQFGAGYPATTQGLRDFRKSFLDGMKKVLVVYPAARADSSTTGIRLAPGRPHVPKLPT